MESLSGETDSKEGSMFEVLRKTTDYRGQTANIKSCMKE